MVLARGSVAPSAGVLEKEGMEETRVEMDF